MSSTNTQFVPRAADAMWNQRSVLRDSRPRIAALLETIGQPEVFTLLQSISLLAMTLEFRPDLILELGRGRGNSTVVLAEAAYLMRPAICQLTSLCLTPHWDRETVPRLRPLVSQEWFDAVSVRTSLHLITKVCCHPTSAY